MKNLEQFDASNADQNARFVYKKKAPQEEIDIEMNLGQNVVVGETDIEAKLKKEQVDLEVFSKARKMFVKANRRKLRLLKKLELVPGDKKSEIKKLVKNAKNLGLSEVEIDSLLRLLTGRNANI